MTRRLHRLSRKNAGALTRAFLANVALPAWAAFGIIDWAFHRATRIERNASTPESLMHVAMGAEGAACALAGLLFEIDAGVLGVMLAAALLHEGTAIWDVAYATHRRLVPQAEQHTHSFMEALPFAVVAFAAAVHPHALRVRSGGDGPRRAFRRARRPLGRASVAAATTAGVLGMAVHVEELVRCVRADLARRQALVDADAPG